LQYEAPISHQIFENTFLVYGSESQSTKATVRKLRALSSNSSRFGYARHIRHLTVYTTTFSIDESEVVSSMQYLKECIISSGVVTDFTAGRKAECLRAGTFEGKIPCPVEASTRIRLSIYTNTPIQINS
jgi:hypothetical protein